MKGVERSRRKKGGTWAGKEVKLPTPSHLKQTISPGTPFLYSVIFCFALSLKTTFSHSVFLELCSSPMVGEGFISLNIFQRQLLFIPDLDLRAVGYGLSSSQLSGILWLFKTYWWSRGIQFMLIPGRSRDPPEGTGSENCGPGNPVGRGGRGLERLRESLSIPATRVQD